jgi:microcystin-dependent protein
MSEPFLAEVRMVAFNFAPRGWAFCDGQLLPINQNQALFSLLGTTFGGDGRVNFALPDFRGRTPIHTGGSAGSQHRLGERSGAETVTLNATELPGHTHTLTATSDSGSSPMPTGNFLGALNNAYRSDGGDAVLASSSVTSVGGNQAHNNMQPFLSIRFCIALQGIFPSPN